MQDVNTGDFWTELSPFFNLRIGSCRLGFDITNNMNPSKPKNMGILTKEPHLSFMFSST